MTIGVLAVQGDVREHVSVLDRLGTETRRVLRPEHLEGLSGIVFPGGESTAMWRLIDHGGLAGSLSEALRGGLPALGTCAGMILLAREITNWHERYLEIMDIAVERNASGRQVDSFERVISCDGLGTLPAVFIRAPYVRRLGTGVKVLGSMGDLPVLVREGNWLAASFHPELTGDTRVHGYFLDMCRKER